MRQRVAFCTGRNRCGDLDFNGRVLEAVFVEDAREVEVVDNEVGSMDREALLSLQGSSSGRVSTRGGGRDKRKQRAIMEHVVEDSNGQSRGQ